MLVVCKINVSYVALAADYTEPILPFVMNTFTHYAAAKSICGKSYTVHILTPYDIKPLPKIPVI